MENNIGLYQLIKKGGDQELDSKDIAIFLSQNILSPEDRTRLKNWQNELNFWEEYGQIYFNLEKSQPYHNLTKTIKKFLDPKKDEKWLDVGAGPLKMSEMIFEKCPEIKEIFAIDIVLKPARDKLEKLNKKGIFLPIKLIYASITDPLSFENESFNGIVVNLVLPYVFDFQGKKGKEAFENVLREMFRVLKPGGRLIWSTPKHNVNFNWVFIASMPDMFNIYEYIVHKDFSRILQAKRILKHALIIQKKGREGIYTFLPKNELEKLLFQIGFRNLQWEKTFAKQVLVNKAFKFS